MLISDIQEYIFLKKLGAYASIRSFYNTGLLELLMINSTILCNLDVPYLGFSDAWNTGKQIIHGKVNSINGDSSQMIRAAKENEE